MIFQFRAGQSLFHRLDPITKGVWLLCVSILALWFHTAITQFAIWLGLLLIGCVLVRQGPYALWRAMSVPLLFGLPYFVVQLIFIRGDTALFQIGQWVITTEALDFAVAITLRFISLMLASYLFIVSTDPRDVVLALSCKLKVPYRFAFAVSIALRFLPIVQEEVVLIQASSRMRGFSKPKGLKLRLASWRHLFMLILLNAIRRVQQTAWAMDARGFGVHANRTYLRTLTISRAAKTCIVFTALTTVALLAIDVMYY